MTTIITVPSMTMPSMPTIPMNETAQFQWDMFQSKTLKQVNKQEGLNTPQAICLRVAFFTAMQSLYQEVEQHGHWEVASAGITWGQHKAVRKDLVHDFFHGLVQTSSPYSMQEEALVLKMQRDYANGAICFEDEEFHEYVYRGCLAQIRRMDDEDIDDELDA